MKKLKPHLKIITVGACLGALAAQQAVHAQTATGDAKLDKLEQENQDLRARLEKLELAAQKEGIMPSGPAQPVKALSSMTISGFATASYFYDVSHSQDDHPNGYLWNRNLNSFSINKVKLTVASPGVAKDKWDAAYRASLIFGEDAPIVNTGGNRQGFQELREAFVELNVPIGTGLDIKAGQLISLLNYESGDGGAVNANFSQGNQWFFTGNGPSTGVQLGYDFNDWIGAKARVQNGLFTGPIDNNGYKTLMGSIDLKVDKKTSVSILGFGGREGASSHDWLKGGSVIASRQLTEKYNLTAATELDYFSLDTGATGTADWYSAGGWLTADLTEKVGIALRADYIKDKKGAGTSGLLGFAANNGQELSSFTLTLNYKPVPCVKIQPELRWDHTTLQGGLNGHQDRFIIGAGVSYLF